MTDHLDEAAAKAIELAERLAGTFDEPNLTAATHLTYLAGLLRGGAGRSSIWTTPAVVPVSEEEFVAKSWTVDDDLPTPIGPEKLNRIEDAIKTADAMERVRAQRDELLAASRELVQTDIEPMALDREIHRLRHVVDRIEAES